jgi:hypothetical protein
MSAAGAGRANTNPWGQVAAEPSHRQELLGGLDALGDRDQPQRVCDAHNVGRDRRVLRVDADALHEGAIDLDDVDREVAEMAERREPGAEVVDGEAATSHRR